MAAVAVRPKMEGDIVGAADIVLNAVGSAPIVSDKAAAMLVGQRLTDALIEEVSDVAWKPAKPLDNTDHENMWRKKMVRVNVKRALASLR